MKILGMVGAIAFSAAACGSQPASTGPEAGGADTAGVTVTLPAGDADAGRQAFMDLKCIACHAVPSEDEFPAPVSASPGPPIDAQVARRDVSYLMTSIMSPSHAISVNTSREVRESLEGVLSPMGDFSRAMTVRQLADVHAYVRSVK